MRVLVLTSYVPYPIDNGSKMDVSNQLRYVSRDHHVTLMCPVRPDSGQVEDALRLVGEYCTEVRAVAWQRRSKLRFLPHLLRYMWVGEPIGNLTFYFEELAEALRHVTAEQHFDVVNVHHAYMAPYLDAIVPQSKCKTVLTLHDVPYQQWRRMMMVEKNLPRKLRLFRDWLFQKHATLRHIRRYDKTITVSESDRSVLLKDAPQANVVAVPAGIDTDTIKLLSEPSAFCNLMFVGSMFYQPNTDAALFLCREIFPLIKSEIPNAHLYIVGTRPPKEVLRLGEQTEAITVTGYVDSVLPYYERCCLTLAPLRAGSGIRIKIMESLALGRPVVSTTLGCEGLQVTHGKNILIADTAADFAAQTVRMMTDRELWRRIAHNGRRQIEQVYDWQITGRQLLTAYEED